MNIRHGLINNHEFGLKIPIVLKKIRTKKVNGTYHFSPISILRMISRQWRWHWRWLHKLLDLHLLPIPTPGMVNGHHEDGYNVHV